MVRLLGNVAIGSVTAVIPSWITAELLPGSPVVWAVFVIWTLAVTGIMFVVQNFKRIDQEQEEV